MTEPTTGWHLWILRPGDKIRLFEDGPIRSVVRVSPGAAYYEILTESTYKVFDTKAGEEHEITRKGRRTEYIAARSFVEMIERGPILTKRLVVETATPVERAVQPRPELPPIEYTKRTRGKRL